MTINKKVLLRERKRHTTRRVVSTPSVVLPGYPPILTWPGGVPCQGGPYLGTPLAWYPPCPDLGLPCWGVSTWVPLAGYPQGTPQQGMPPGRVPPPAGPGQVPP